MILLILAYLGGVLTIFSPCVLPVIPFLFSQSDRSFRQSGLPMLLGMALSFATVAALSVIGGSWVVQANQWGRILALILFGVVGLSLIFASFAERLASPFVKLGSALQKKANAGSGFWSSLLIGASVGLLWAPCTGPILGLLLAGAALGHSPEKTFELLLVFGLGAATSLGVAVFASGQLLKTLKKALGAEVWIKRILGITVLCAVLAIALGWDTKLLAQFSYLNTNALEQTWVDQFHGKNQENSPVLFDEGPMPPLDGATLWLNSPPLSPESLRGKVVLVDFWTYSCINCLRTLPYLKTWYSKYHSRGLEIIGVHAPEFAFEKDPENVKKAVRELGISYPVALDNHLTIWRAFNNQYWPADYFIDAQGRIRHEHFGEGDYEESEKVIQELLDEAHPGTEDHLNPSVEIEGEGVEAPPSRRIGSPETYLGYERTQGFASTPSLQPNQIQNYRDPSHLALNQWSLKGEWEISAQKAILHSRTGTLSFRFSARDLHLVIGTSTGKSIPFRVTLDGAAPAADHGVDTDPHGNGQAKDHRLYQLIRQRGDQNEHLFKIEFLEPGAEVYAFTFG